MTALTVPRNFGAISAKFASAPVPDDLGAGISGGFGVISYKGKVWKIKYQGQENILMREDGDGARSSIEVVVIKAASVISKIWYESGYVDGSTAPPDCWSTNGQTPDPASPKKQSNTCAGCPMNAWGSKVTDAGKPGKACADSKRLAVVPLADITNEAFNGPMLLRVPAASLKDLKSYGDKLGAVQYPYYAVGTRIGFDVNEAFPKFAFNPIRALTDEEADAVLALRDDPRVNRILNEAVEVVRHEPEAPAAPTVESLFEQPPPPKAAPAPAQKPAQAAPKPAPKPAPAPVQPVQAQTPHDPDTGEVVEEAAAAPSNFDEMLDKLLEG